jgi:acyl-CoA synthetase (NDP forming)
VFDHLFSPKSIVLVGVSRKGGASRRLLETLMAHGFDGELAVVNPSAHEINGAPCFPSVDAVPGVPDLALVVVPAPEVPAVVQDCGDKGIPAAIIFSAGFADDRSPEGRRLQAELERAISRTGIRVVGPNCLGYLNAQRRIVASWSSSVGVPAIAAHFLPDGDTIPAGFDALTPSQGSVAIIAQSGGLGFSLFNRGLGRGIRFSHVISAGNEVDLEVQDFLEFLLDDTDTRVILLYVEGLKDPTRFQALAARAEQLGKSIVMAKVGRSQVAARAAMSHTGHIAGDDRAFDAVFDRYGIIRVHDAEEMLDVGLVLSTCSFPAGNRVGVVSYSGGNAVWMADACDDLGLELPTLSPRIQERLGAALPSFAATANPVDISGASKTTPADVLAIVADDPDVDALVLIATYNRADAVRSDQPSLERLRAGTKPVLLYSYTEPSPEARPLLEEIGIPAFTSTARCARALQALVTAGRHRPEPSLGPWAHGTAVREAASLWSRAVATVTEHQVKALLGGAGLPVTLEQLATTREGAAAVAGKIGYPVALKVQSPDVPHKAKAGGVALGLTDAAAVATAFDRIMSSVGTSHPSARIDGVLVQEMAGTGVELLVGVQNTSGLGPMVMVGVGGAAVEVLGHTLLYPAPFGAPTARRLLHRIPVGALLAIAGVDDVDEVLESVAEIVSTVSRLGYELRDELAELDLNPVIVQTADGRPRIVDAVASVLHPNA